jgi:hypothetical protein
VCEKANFVGFYNATSMNNAIDNNQTFSLAIQFSDDLLGARSNDNLPSEVEITLRLVLADLKPFSESCGQCFRLPSAYGSDWLTNKLYPADDSMGARFMFEGYGGSPGRSIVILV